MPQPSHTTATAAVLVIVDTRMSTGRNGSLELKRASDTGEDLIEELLRRRTSAGASVDAANVPAAAQRCHRVGPGACASVSHTVPQGHDVSLLDVLTIEIRDAKRCHEPPLVSVSLRVEWLLYVANPLRSVAIYATPDEYIN